MTDPEATLRETLSDEVLRKVVEAAEIYWAIEGPVIRDRQAMRDVIISAAAPLLTPRAWQPPACHWIADDEGVYDTSCGQKFFFDTDGATENKAAFCCYCGGTLIDVKYVEPPAPKELQRLEVQNNYIATIHEKLAQAERDRDVAVSKRMKLAFELGKAKEDRDAARAHLVGLVEALKTCLPYLDAGARLLQREIGGDNSRPSFHKQLWDAEKWLAASPSERPPQENT